MQKVRGPSSLALARQLTVAGIRTVYASCDLIEVSMVAATDATIIVTEYLKAMHPCELHPRIHVVHDGIEQPLIRKSNWGREHGSSIHPLKAILVTSAALDNLPVLNSPPNWLKVKIVGKYSRGVRKWTETRWTWMLKSPPERLRYLRFLLDRRIECIPWEPEGVYEQMLTADIALIPIDKSIFGQPTDSYPTWKMKSENRLTMKMSIGLPVIATPIPAYESVIEHGVNGFFAHSKHDWTKCLLELRDPALRRQIGLAARKSVAGKYSIEKQAQKFITVLTSMHTH